MNEQDPKKVPGAVMMSRRQRYVKSCCVSKPGDSPEKERLMGFVELPDPNKEAKAGVTLSPRQRYLASQAVAMGWKTNVFTGVGVAGGLFIGGLAGAALQGAANYLIARGVEAFVDPRTSTVEAKPKTPEQAKMVHEVAAKHGKKASKTKPGAVLAEGDDAAKAKFHNAEAEKIGKEAQKHYSRGDMKRYDTAAAKANEHIALRDHHQSLHDQKHKPKGEGGGQFMSMALGEGPGTVNFVLNKGQGKKFIFDIKQFRGAGVKIISAEPVGPSGGRVHVTVECPDAELMMFIRKWAGQFMGAEMPNVPGMKPEHVHPKAVKSRPMAFDGFMMSRRERYLASLN